MKNELIRSEDGRLEIRVSVEDDGEFHIDIMATQVMTSVKATTEQDMGAVHVSMRGKIEDRFKG